MIALVVAGALLGLFLSAFFSGAETGLYRINRLRLHLGVKHESPDALRLSGVLDDEHGALTVTLVGTNLANYVTTSAVAYLFAVAGRFGETKAEMATVALVTPILFVFGEVVPKNLFRLHADALLARGSRLLVFFDRLFRATGLVWALKGLAGAFSRFVSGHAEPDHTSAPKRRVALLLHEALAGTTLSEDQSDMIDRVCRLSETPLHTVMVPRNRVTTVRADTDRRGLVRVARRTGHAQLPVFESRPRHIAGVIKVDRLLQSEDWRSVVEHLEPPLDLNPHDTVAAAITRLQRAGRSMAIITGHGGQMLGIVTLKDLLREVIGEVAMEV
jgi:CBS domain containing-hemolysin-like protein